MQPRVLEMQYARERLYLGSGVMSGCSPKVSLMTLMAISMPLFPVMQDTSPFSIFLLTELAVKSFIKSSPGIPQVLTAYSKASPSVCELLS